MACPCKDELDLYPITIGNMAPEVEPYRECIELAFCHLQCIIDASNKEAVFLTNGTLTEGLVVDFDYLATNPNGAGIIASAGPTEIRSNGWQTARGNITIYDNFFSFVGGVSGLPGSSTIKEQKCLSVIKHEMLHVLTIPFWNAFSSAAGQWTGANASAQYTSYGGAGGLQSFDNSFHWEVDQLLNEILVATTGPSSNGDFQSPLSRISIGALIDGGYSADLSKAEHYEYQPVIDTVNGDNVHQAPSRRIVKLNVCEMDFPRTIVIQDKDMVTAGGFIDPAIEADLSFSGTFPACLAGSGFINNGLAFIVEPDSLHSPGDICTLQVETFYQGSSIGVTDVEFQWCITDNPLLAQCVQDPDVSAVTTTFVNPTGSFGEFWPSTSGANICFTNQQGISNLSDNGTFFSANLSGTDGFFDYVAYNDCGQGEAGRINLTTVSNCPDWTLTASPGFSTIDVGQTVTVQLSTVSQDPNFNPNPTYTYTGNVPGVSVVDLGNGLFQITGVTAGTYPLVSFSATSICEGDSTTKEVFVTIEVNESNVIVCPEWTLNISPPLATIGVGQSVTVTVTPVVSNSPTNQPTFMIDYMGLNSNVSVTETSEGVFVVTGLSEGNVSLMFSSSTICDGQGLNETGSSTVVVEGDDPPPTDQRTYHLIG